MVVARDQSVVPLCKISTSSGLVKALLVNHHRLNSYSSKDAARLNKVETPGRTLALPDTSVDFQNKLFILIFEIEASLLSVVSMRSVLHLC